MRNFLRFVSILTLSYFILPYASAQAQVQDTGPGLSSRAKTLYLVEIAQADPASNVRELNKFATTFLELRLSRVSGVKIVRLQALPRCVSGSIPAQESRAQSTVSSQEKSFYVLSGSIEVHRTDAAPNAESKGATINELILNYELLKIDQCKPSPVLRRFEPFTERDVLNSFSLAGNLLAASLVNDLKPPVDIKQIQLMSDGSTQKTVSDELLDVLVNRLAFGNAFRPRDLRKEKPETPAEYALETRLTFTRTKNPIRIAEGSPLGTLSDVEATFFAVVSDASSPSTVHRYQIAPGVKKSLSARGDFYEAAAQAVAQGLADLHSAREAHLTEELAKLENNAGLTLRAFETKNLLARAREFLCIGMEGPCAPRSQAALPLLVELDKRPPEVMGGDEKRETESLLGQALYLNGEFLKSAEAFDSAASLASSPEDQIDLLNQAGDASYRAQNYSEAAERYAKSLEISKSNAATLPANLLVQPEVRVKYARSLRFNGKRLDAIDALLGSIKVVPDPNLIVREMKELFSAFPPGTELTDGVKRLQGAGEASLAPALSAGYSRMASFYAASGDFFQAVQAIQQSIASANSNDAQYKLALYSYLWAKQPKADGKPSPPSYKRIAELVTSLVQARYPESDALLIVVNHEISADMETKHLFETIRAQSPKDVSVLRGTMSLCTDYLKDFECALGAAVALEKLAPDTDLGLVMDLAEIRVLSGKYEDALQRMQPIVAKGELDPGLRAVADFYLTWSFLALNQETEARKAVTQWTADITKLRSLKADLGWTFSGAESALAVARLTAEYKGSLGKMLAAMQNPESALPKDPLMSQR